MNRKTRLCLCLPLVLGWMVFIGELSAHGPSNSLARILKIIFSSSILFGLTALIASRSRRIGSRPLPRLSRPLKTLPRRETIAVIDKSTTGKLLASRARRDPGVRAVVAPPTEEAEFWVPRDTLWDREIDG